ncbi:type II toxin-antitoxin system PemK/MazF family toxin [Candidatus Kuenenia sp.]|uniref:type II toxin-antitoxin system PemK/MazF family toxin n=1 Tax=Candidatus Kuenenia sp. TaxID=2499824 RepID=UPI00322047B5
MKQKEIWLINLDPSIGAEIRKTRPCVILNDDSIGVLPLKVVAPITDYKEKYKVVPWMIQLIPDKLNNLGKISVIDVFQMRSVSEKRLIRKLGVIREDDILKAKEALKLVFGL